MMVTNIQPAISGQPVLMKSNDLLGYTAGIIVKTCQLPTEAGMTLGKCEFVS